MRFEYQFVSAMEKIFCRQNLTAEKVLSPAGGQLQAVRGGFAAVQLALKCDFNVELEFTASPPEGVSLSLREVGLVPCDMPSSPGNHDAFTSEPGLFPDPLLELEKPVRLTCGNWHAVFITADVSLDCSPGSYSIPSEIKTYQHPGCPWKLPFDFQEKIDLRLVVHASGLAPQKLICTNWFYCDCLAHYYKVPLWSEDFWVLARNYWSNMAANGRNMLLVPLWTPPLDTAIGHERPVTQLLKIYWKNGCFSFDFSLLKKFLDTAQSCGITCFEMVHLFTQWGAEATPLIMVETEKGKEKLFGWHVPSTAPLYRKFLNALLPELADFLKKENLKGKVYFHISDEPTEKKLQVYSQASALVREYLPEKDFPIIDALSYIEFYRKKLLSIPVASVTHWHDFEQQPLRERWCYFAGDMEKYTTSAFGVPSGQNRIIGVLLYLYKMDGFLHWGHNFWFSQYSLDFDLDPWRDTTAGKAFAGGGAFNVYPGKDGRPVESLHYKIFSLALQDLRLFRTLEEKIGFEAVKELIHQGLDYEITMDHFPRSSEWFESLYLRILEKLSESR